MDNRYGQLSTQTLPPMRVAPGLIEDDQAYYQARTQLKPQPKEEKAIGDVSTHLGYAMAIQVFNGMLISPVTSASHPLNVRCNIGGQIRLRSKVGHYGMRC